MELDLEFVRQYIVRDMSEGVMTIGLNGVIASVNPAALAILGRSEEELLGRPFAASFFDYEENDAFNQSILDAVYDTSTSHRRFVQYFTGTEMKQLQVVTSYLKDGDVKKCVIAVISDITELMELRDALQAMKRIEALNDKLELRNKLLSETFGRFLSDDIVRQLLDTPDGLALGGKKMRVSIMMSDLRGFTALSESMEAQDLLTMLNHYLGEMTEIIQKHNGTIIEFIGDGIMAIFGAPNPYADHAAQCVAAAVEMEAAMTRVNAWNREHGFPELLMGIGVNTGDAIVGNIGSEKRTKYGVTGNQVNLAGRIEGCTVGGQLLVCESTCAEIEASLTIESEQQIKPKGVDHHVNVYAVTGIGAPYDLHYETVKEEILPLAKEIPVTFYTIESKNVSDDMLTGCFTALSEGGAILKTEAKLNLLDNLQMDIGGHLFAKVIAGGEGSFELRFTAKPSNFKEWYKASR